MMFSTDRFIASAMSLVRIAPDAPTSAPAMIRTSLPSTKPAIATAVPVNELSRQMTTGMSAPPIGRTIVTPKMSDAARMTSMTGDAEVAGPQVDGADDRPRPRAPAVTIRPPGMRIGLPAIRPWSLPDAISEPVNVMLPMTMSRTVATLISDARDAFAALSLR